MRRSLLALGVVGILYSCGGGGGVGSDSQGFYSLGVSVTTGTVNSPAATYDGQYVRITPDTIEGTILLSYGGTSSRALSGYLKEVKLCIGTTCFPVGIGGILPPGQEKSWKVEISSHKFNPPWVVVNPYEDEVIEENILSDVLSSGVQSASAADQYYNSQRTVYLASYPVVDGSLQMSASGTFLAGTVYSGYDSSLGTVTVLLVKGANTANSIVPSTFVADVVGTGIVCIDDGTGNIVQQGGGTDCSGTIDYTNGVVQIAVNNVTSPTDIDMTYQVDGSLLCWDDAGSLVADCNGTIQYTTGQLTYAFRFNFVSVPVNVSISYQYQTGTSDGKTYTYTLPADGADPQNMNLKIRYGEWIGIYLGGTLLCATDMTGGSCSITKNGRQVTVSFPTPQTGALTISYSEMKKYDFNPSIDAGAYNHLWNGSSTAYVSGSLFFTAELEDGTALSTQVPITFFVYPQETTSQGSGIGGSADSGTLF